MPAIGELLRRKRQYEALGGRLTRQETAGIVSGGLIAEHEKAIRAEELGLRRRRLQEEIRLREEQAEAESLAGYLQTGATLLGTEPGKRLATAGLAKLGLGVAGAQTGRFVAAGGGAAATGFAPFVSPAAAVTAGVPEAVGIASQIGATGGAVGATGTLTAGLALGGGGVVGQGIQAVTGSPGAGALAGAGAGAVIGGAVLGPPGAIIGGIIGGVTGGKVICTYLYEKGYLPEEIYELDAEFGTMLDADVYTGYRMWADYVVGLMKKSELITKIVSLLAIPWAKEMAHIMNPIEYESNSIGKILMGIGIPVCRFLGKKRVEVRYG